LLKTELTARKPCRTRDETKADVFDSVERFDNPKRRQPPTGDMSRVDLEMKGGLA
jgi:putative transposase